MTSEQPPTPPVAAPPAPAAPLPVAAPVEDPPVAAAPIDQQPAAPQPAGAQPTGQQPYVQQTFIQPAPVYQLVPTERIPRLWFGIFGFLMAVLALLVEFGPLFVYPFVDTSQIPLVVDQISRIASAAIGLVALVFGLIGLSQSKGRAMSGFAIATGLVLLVLVVYSVTGGVAYDRVDFWTAVAHAFGFLI